MTGEDFPRRSDALEASARDSGWPILRAYGPRPVAMAIRIEVETWIMSNAAQNLLQSIERTGWKAPEGARILDFGCGDGSRVYQFRDLGYDLWLRVISPPCNLCA